MFELLTLRRYLRGRMARGAWQRSIYEYLYIGVYIYPSIDMSIDVRTPNLSGDIYEGGWRVGRGRGLRQGDGSLRPAQGGELGTSIYIYICIYLYIYICISG